MQKVIFLDIDGVLNSDLWNEKNQHAISGGLLIDSDKVELLSEIVIRTGANIVLHSGWKFWFNSKLEPLRKESHVLVELFEQRNLAITDITPDFSTEEIRKTKKFSLVKGKEILAWLDEHPNVENWIVIDDLDLHNDEMERHQVRTNQITGLTREDVNLAIDMLHETRV